MEALHAPICAFQPSYSSANTSAMQDCGRLIRAHLARGLSNRLTILVEAFTPQCHDLRVEPSDCIGRKTEARHAGVFF